MLPISDQAFDVYDVDGDYFRTVRSTSALSAVKAALTVRCAYGELEDVLDGSTYGRVTVRDQETRTASTFEVLRADPIIRAG